MQEKRGHSIQSNRGFTNIFHNPLTAWVILVFSLILTFGAYHTSKDFLTQRAHDQFEFRATQIEHAIEDRLRIYEQQLWSGVGLFYASESVQRSAFKKFVTTMNIEQNWPGIQGVGFSVPVTPKNKEAHIQSIRAEGFPTYTIKPEGKRDMYSAIIYLEPFDWRNKRAFGYDMWSNEMRRNAMTRARDEGVAATSGVITLVQETTDNVQKGFLTYVPVYKSKTTPNTVKERREQFLGWVYAPYRAGDLMKGIVGSEDTEIEFEIFDGEEVTSEALIYDSNEMNHLDEKKHKPFFSKTVSVVNQGRPWTIYFSTPYDYQVSSIKNQSRFIALVGIVIDIFLFYVIYSLYFINKRAEELARNMTTELEKSKDSLEGIVNKRTQELEQARDRLEEQVAERTKELAHKLEQLEKVNDVMIGREKKMVELKKENEELRKKLS